MEILHCSARECRCWGVGILTRTYVQVGWGDLCFIEPKNIPDYSKSVQELLPIDAETRQKTIHDSSEADCLIESNLEYVLDPVSGSGWRFG